MTASLIRDFGLTLFVANLHRSNCSQIAKFMGPTWGPPGSWRPQMGPMLAPWTLLSMLVCCELNSSEQTSVYQNTIITTQESAFENVLYKMSPILFRSQWVNTDISGHLHPISILEPNNKVIVTFMATVRRHHLRNIRMAGVHDHDITLTHFPHCWP